MLCAGISPINKEWFHFQLPNTESYDLISVEDARKAESLPYSSAPKELMFYDIFTDYQNEESDEKTHFWIHDKKYYERFTKISLDEFLVKIKEHYSV